MLRLHTLGRLELTRSAPGGVEVIPLQPKRLLLLAYLILAGGSSGCRRDTLLGLFWPESSEDDARRALRQALYYLRNAVGDGVLPSRSDELVEVAPGALWVDAGALEQCLAAGKPAEALECYGGEFLAGVYLAGASAELEQWIDATRARLRVQAARAAWLVARAAEAGGDPVSAAAAARRAVALEPDDESGYRRLMELLHRHGDRLGALRVYEELAARLRREYGAEPAAETRALALRLRAPSPEPASAATPVPTSVPTALPAPRAEPDPVAMASSLGGATGGAILDGSASGRERWRRWGLLAAGVALLAAGGAVVHLRSDAEGMVLARSAASAQRDRILVADLQNRTRDSLLAAAIGEALRVDLAQSRRVSVLSHQQVRSALARMQQQAPGTLTDSLAREAALREGVKIYVAGSIGSVGRGYVISAELVASESGDVLDAVQEFAADSTLLLEALDRLAAGLRRRLGESVATVRSAPPLEQVTTRSLVALRKYSEGVRVAEREGNDRLALPLLHEAIALDSGFAMAWRKLAVVASNIGEFGLAQIAAERAFEHRDRLPDRERYTTMANYYTNHDHPIEALRAYNSLLELYPADVRALNNIGFVYQQLRDFRRSEEYYRRAVAADSTIAVIHWNLATVLLSRGKLDEAAAQLRRTLERFPYTERARWLEVDLAIARGDLAGAERMTRALLDAAADDHVRHDRGLRTLATLALMRGRVREAERHLAALESVLRREGSPSERAVLAAWLGFVDAWFRQGGERAAARMEQSLAELRLDTVPVTDRHNEWRGYVYALAGSPARAYALVAEARTVPPEGIGREAELLRVEGAVRLAEGDVARAVALLRRAANEHFCPICVLPDLARAYERAGRADSAIAIYERYLDTPWSERWSADGEFTGHALLRIGELSEARGDSRRAAQAYRRFVELWADADPEFQPLVTRARERFSVLGGPRD